MRRAAYSLPPGPTPYTRNGGGARAHRGASRRSARGAEAHARGNASRGRWHARLL